MSTNKTQPDKKGFLESIKETIEEFWDGPKQDTASNVRPQNEAQTSASKNSVDDTKNKVTEKIKTESAAIKKNTLDSAAQVAKQTEAIKAKARQTPDSGKSAASAATKKAANKSNKPAKGKS
ncbi:hypothetical protein ACFQZX_11325 [Mucilaginibacter litoreus]|uniref:Uncharacterized protein n=1 Tax=Mucilaginibacter litoreus TaxID=1048221 RepID=A0ABW3AT32_9SPHI